MEGGRRSSTVLLLLLVALMLAASSTTAAAEAQRRQPAADGSYYKLISVQTSLGDKVKLATKADGSSVAGFANNKNNWFAIQGSEDLLQSYRDSRYIGGGNIPGNGLATLLGALVKKNATS